MIEPMIPEIRGGAHHDPLKQAELLSEAIEKSLSELNPLNPEALIDQRYNKFKAIGVFTE